MAALTSADISAIHTGHNFFVKPNAAGKLGLRPRFKKAYITLAATADNADTCTIDIQQQFGMTRFLGILGFIQTTADSVIAAEAPTTTFDQSTLVITVGGATPNKKRTYVIFGL